MMIILVFLYYTLAYDPGRAVSITSSLDSRNTFSHSAAVREADIAVLNCPRKRLEIIWSCIATILAASWVSVHPNLPHPSDSKLKKTLRRVELMLWAIITPELIIFWAMRQWNGARMMEREFAEYLNEEQSEEHVFRWTKTHGFFLQMGGFVLEDGSQRKGVLGWKTLMELYKAGRINLSDITEARINDHSKADAFSKGLALLQTFWFIIQCIARFSNINLVLTELELVTAALAVLSLAMYFLWWNKPFNAEIPIVINLCEPQNVSSSNVNLDENGQGNGTEKLDILKYVLLIFQHIWRRLQEMVERRGEYGVTYTEEDPTDHQPGRALIVKVPTFYSIKPESNLAWLQMLCTGSSIAALFGAIHCVGWSSKIVFTSHPSVILWRVSSVIITACPVLWNVLSVSIYAEDIYRHRRSAKFYSLCMLNTLIILLAATIPLYIAARVILFILAFVELHDLPPGALGTIQWSGWVPFIH